MREYERRRRWTPWHGLALLLILVGLVVALVLIYRLTDSGPSRSLPSRAAAAPTAAASASASGPTASPSTEPPPAPSRPATVTQPPAPTPGEVTDSAPGMTLSPEELNLAAALRADADVDCVPRRTDLPPGAIAGVECRPSAGDAERVGIYEFEDDRAAALAYLERMTEAGVSLGDSTSDCANGGFDTLWVLGEDEENVEESESVVEYRGRLFNVFRWGCFVNENGVANVRVLCGHGLYIGVLGRSGDPYGLVGWTNSAPEGPSTGDLYREDSRPGICNVGDHD